MKISDERLAVYPSDLQRMTGQSERTCQRLLNRIKDMFGLGKRQYVTVRQTAEYMGVPISEVSQFLK